MRFSTSPPKKTSPSRSTNTLWQFNYNIPFFQLVLFYPFSLSFSCFLQRCCYFPITLTRLRWHWCVHVYTVCSSVHQQAIHVVSHTCKERKEENENEKSSFRSQLFNYVWQLEIFCLFLSSDSVGEWKWESGGEKFMLSNHNRLPSLLLLLSSMLIWIFITPRRLLVLFGCIQS